MNTKEDSRQREHKPEMRSLRNRKEASVAGTKGIRKTIARDDVRDIIRARVRQGLGGQRKDSGLYSKVMGSH